MMTVIIEEQQPTDFAPAESVIMLRYSKAGTPQYNAKEMTNIRASESIRTTVVDTLYRERRGIMLDVVDTPYRGGVLCLMWWIQFAGEIFTRF